MVSLLSAVFLLLVSMASVLVCCGLLSIICRVAPLARRQRAALWGVGDGR